MVFEGIKADVVLSLTARRLLHALESLSIRPDFAKALTMQVSKALALSFSLLSISSSAAPSCSVASTSTATMAAVPSASSTPGQTQTGVYDSSTTPSYLPWNTYNYCNAPHVNAVHYTMPKDASAEMVYMNVMIRHHKVSIPPDNYFLAT